MKLSSLFQVLCLYCSQCVCSQERKELSILTMGPFHDPKRDPGWDGGPALIPAARLAVDHINSRNDVLPGYTLSLLEADSGCSLLDKTRINFIDQVYHKGAGQSIVGMVGPGCSEATMAVADLITLSSLNIMQVSIATTPDISATLYNNSFRTVGSSLVYIDVFLKIMSVANWTNIGVLYENSRAFHIHTASAFRNAVPEHSINYYNGVEQRFLSTTIQEIVEQRLRIVFVFAGRSIARKILCIAYRMDLVHPTVQFLLIERELGDFKVNVTSGEYSCSPEDMEEAIMGVISFTNRFERENKTTTDTVSGISYEEYMDMYWDYLDLYLDEINVTKSSIPGTAFNYFNGYYDAVWALALSLNESMDELDLVEAFHQSVSNEVGDIIREGLKEISFQGMTGLIAFDEVKRDLSGIGIVLHQFILNNTGSFDDGTLKFTGTYIPDSFNESTYRVHPLLGTVVLAIALAITAFLIPLQIGFIVHSEHKVVKASSPHLNHLIFSGCYLCILALISFTTIETFPDSLSTFPVLYGVTCSIVYWCSSLAFSLVFGTVCAKTWRVYRIFSHFKQGRVKYVSDEFLILFVSFLILIDLSLNFSWNAIDPWYRDVRYRNQQKRYMCMCENFEIWIGTLFVYKGAIMALAVVLSLLIRRVKKKAFNSTKITIGLVYCLVLIYITGMFTNIIFVESIPVLSFLGLSVMYLTSVIIIASVLLVFNIRPVIRKRLEQSSMKLKRGASFRNEAMTIEPSNLSRRSVSKLNRSASKTTSPMCVPKIIVEPCSIDPKVSLDYSL